MNDVEFCKRRLGEIAEHGTVSDLQSQVKSFLKARLPASADQRAVLKSWANAELTRLEGVPGTGMSKVVATHNLALTSRRMAVLQTVIAEIEAAEFEAKQNGAGLVV
jgi:hypothetical protein